VALVTATARMVEAEVTEVQVIDLTEQQIADYIASGEPMGKAGAYGIQGRAARFIQGSKGATSTWLGCRWRGFRRCWGRFDKEK